jgi:WhiB family redox-sensing transcriptional regulator
MSYYASKWRESGACVTADPDLFFPLAKGGSVARQAEQARRICAGCDVRRQCLQFAMDSGETDGIWGGTTPEERERARRRRAYARRTAAAQAERREAPETAA